MEELLINAKVNGGNSVNQLANDVDKLGTEVTDTAKAYDKLAASEKSANSAAQTIIATNQKMKTAFEVVGSTLQVASTDAKMFQKNLLSLKFPEIGNAADKEVKILYKAFIQAQQIGENSFDMLSLATRVFKGDINQVTLAVASYNELFEKNPGVDAVTLNTSAFIALRNQIVATGGSISSLNKEIGQMSTGIFNVSAGANMASTFKQSVNIIRELESELGRSSDYLKILGLESTNTADGINISSEAATKFSNSLDKSVSSAKELYNMYDRINMVLSTSGDELAKSRIFEGAGANTVGQLEAYKSSIIGLREQISLLERQFELMPKLERDTFGPETTARITKLKGELASASNSIGGFATSARNARTGGFDPLSNSIMQVAREMPNFAISAQIGFMAISNNLPILGDAIANFKEMQKQAKQAGEEVPSMGKSIAKGIFSLGGALTLLSGAFMIFGPKIIKWFSELENQTSKDFKIRLSIDEAAMKKVATDTEKIRLFAVDYNKASRDGNKERLKELEKIALKEYDLNKDKLKAITTNVDAWRDAFKEYLKIAKDTYYNEALAKKKSENELNREIQKTNIEFYEREFMAEGRRRGESIAYTAKLLKEMQTGDFGSAILSNAGQKLEELYGIENTLIKETLLLNSTKFRDVYSSKKPDEDKGTGGTKDKYNPAKLKDDPKVVEAELVAKEIIKWENWKLEELTNLEKAQIAISEYRAKNAPKIGDNEFTQLANDSKLLKAELEDVEVAIQKSNEAMSDAEQKKKDFTITNERYNKIQDAGNNLLEDEAFKINELSVETLKLKDLEDSYNNSTGPAQAKVRKELVDEQKNVIKSKEEELKLIKTYIDANKEEQNVYLDKLNNLKEGTKEYEDAYSALQGLIVKRAQLLEADKDNENEVWRKKVAMVQSYISAIKDSFAALDTLTQGSMDLTDQKFNQEVWDNEESTASAEEKEKKLYDIEMRRYEAQIENFELQKKYKEAQAWMDFASGSVSLWTAPGIQSLAPFGYILAGIQQAALLATTIGNVNTIKSQTMDKPHRPGASSSGAGGGANIALNPSKTSLTSKEENLNMMNRSGQVSTENVVKVSDINKVQSTVKVRENNSSY